MPWLLFTLIILLNINASKNDWICTCNFCPAAKEAFNFFGHTLNGDFECAVDAPDSGRIIGAFTPCSFRNSVLGTSQKGSSWRTNFALGPIAWLHSHHQQELWSGRQRHLYSQHLQTSTAGEWRTQRLELFLLCVLGFVITEMECKRTIYTTERAKSPMKTCSVTYYGGWEKNTTLQTTGCSMFME